MKLKINQRIYFVESLLLPAVICYVLSFVDTMPEGKNRLYITAKTKDGKIIEGYETQFSTTKPVPYNTSIHYEPEKYAGLFWDNSTDKPVTIANLKEKITATITDSIKGNGQRLKA